MKLRILDEVIVVVGEMSSARLAASSKSEENMLKIFLVLFTTREIYSLGNKYVASSTTHLSLVDEPLSD